jgi:hypothetical protein
MQQPLPETIRGAWYNVGSGGSVAETVQEDGEILVFDLDGGFVRYELDEGHRAKSEEGDYTFDGQFLILRGKNTTTYRVDVEAPWRWRLEGKRDERLLLRGLVDRDESIDVSGERSEAIGRTPGRVFVRSDFDGEEGGEICTFVHEPKDGETIEIGACYTDGDEEVFQIYLTPFVEGLDRPTWEKVVIKAYLDVHRDGPRPDDYAIEVL